MTNIPFTKIIAMKGLHDVALITGQIFSNLNHDKNCFEKYLHAHLFFIPGWNL